MIDLAVYKIDPASPITSVLIACRPRQGMADLPAADRRPQFGGRVLGEGEDVFKHNAWDNVTWDQEQVQYTEVYSTPPQSINHNGSRRLPPRCLRSRNQLGKLPY